VSEQGLTSPLTQYRLSVRQLYRSKDPTNSIEVLKEDKHKHKKRKKNTIGLNTHTHTHTNTQKHRKSPSLQ